MDVIDLTIDQILLASTCMQELNNCCHNSPVYQNQKRDQHMKSCHEKVIKCYSSLLNKDNKKIKS